jgi:hypothetical protein
MSEVQSQTDLMSILNFTPDDLEQNRSGTLSEMQHYHLRVRRRRAEIIGVLVILFGVLLATALIYASRRSDSVILFIVGVALTICCAAITGAVVRFWLRLNSDINGQRVLINSGTLERVLKPVNRRVMTYILRVDGAEVSVSKDVFKAFIHEQPYTLYRAPYSGTLLSAESNRRAAN